MHCLAVPRVPSCAPRDPEPLTALGWGQQLGGTGQTLSWPPMC